MVLGMTPAIAEVYRWVDDRGVVHFSDTPQPGAKRIELKPPTIYTPRTIAPIAPATRKGSAASAGSQSRVASYPDLKILGPRQNQVIRSNDGKVAVELQIGKPLKRGQRLRVYLDDVEVASGLSATSLVLSDVDRGSHKLAFSVFDADGTELARSPDVTFHLQRYIPTEGTGGNEGGGTSSEPFTPDFTPDNSSTPYAPPSGSGNSFSPDFAPTYKSQ